MDVTYLALIAGLWMLVAALSAGCARLGGPKQ
jgi:hypothetical protein